MKALHIVAPLMAAFSLASAPAQARPASPPAAVALPVAAADGVVQLRSANGFDDTVARLKADVADPGPAAGRHQKIRRATLILFGNPPLGVQFLQSNPYAGLDWPVRMLVIENADGSVSVAWTDFGFIAHRYRITDRAPQLKMASEVAASIATAATTR